MFSFHPILVAVVATSTVVSAIVLTFRIGRRNFEGAVPRKSARSAALLAVVIAMTWAGCSRSESQIAPPTAPTPSFAALDEAGGATWDGLSAEERRAAFRRIIPHFLPSRERLLEASATPAFRARLDSMPQETAALLRAVLDGTLTPTPIADLTALEKKLFDAFRTRLEATKAKSDGMSREELLDRGKQIRLRRTDPGSLQGFVAPLDRSSVSVSSAGVSLPSLLATLGIAGSDCDDARATCATHASITAEAMRAFELMDCLSSLDGWFDWFRYGTGCDDVAEAAYAEEFETAYTNCMLGYGC